MKKSTLLLNSAVFLGLFSLVLVHSVEAQKAGWKGKIETQNGVRVVNNPKVPLSGDIQLDLAEDLSIGKEGDPNLQFFGIRDIAVDGQGNIYVVDMRNYRVQKFDKDGSYILTIGRQGQGPGEFELPTDIRIDDRNGDVYVRDRVISLKIFDQNGSYLNRDIKLKNVIVVFFIDEDGNIVSVLSKTSDEELTSVHSLAKLNSTGEIVGSYGEYPHTAYMKKKEGGTFMATTGFELSVQLAKLDPKTFVYGYSKNYELDIIDKNGQLLYKIRKDEAIPEFSSKEKTFFKKIPQPEQKPYFFSILADSEGRIYVQRNMAATGRGPVDRENLQADVFAKEGYFLFRTTLPPNTKVIRNGYLYAYAVDEEKGMEYVKRFRIKNWEDLGRVQAFLSVCDAF